MTLNTKILYAGLGQTFMF